MGAFVNTIDVLGDAVVADSIVDGSITEFCDDAITKIYNYAFYPGTELTKVNLPSAIAIGVSSFEGNSKLTSVDLASIQRFPANVFTGCSGLRTLVIRTNTIPRLDGGPDAFKNTPIANGTGYIYVPRALLSDEDSTKDYRRADNWSTFSAQFRALEDYTVDGTTTGELDPTKTGG